MAAILDDISTENTTIDLRENFPLPLRGIFRKSIKWLVTVSAIIILVIYVYLAQDPVPDGAIANTYENFATYIIISLIISTTIRLIYEYIYHKTYSYVIDNGHLVITFGVFRRHRAAFPIDSITDIFLDRDLIDMFFGVYTLTIASASGDTTLNPDTPHGMTFIKNMKRKDATGLQEFLTELIRASRPEVKNIKKIVTKMKKNLEDD